jgi:ribosomal-protein-alanine N-acetyltransferase
MAISDVWSPAVTPTLLDLDAFDRMAAYWHHSFDLDQARQIVRDYPGRSVWLESARECVIVGGWRRRSEMASVFGVHAVRHRRELMSAAAERAFSLGMDGIVVIEWNETLNPTLYASAGFELLDGVVPYEVIQKRFPGVGTPSMPIHLLNATRPDVVDQLVEVDHEAFEWLWINSREEFEHCAESPEVEMWGQFDGGRLISYIGITTYGPWGHIDRLAVRPAWQGKRLGDDLTRFGIHRLADLGCSTVGLSTQISNWRSQRLYSRLGFKRTESDMYRIYGRMFVNR